MIPAAYAIVACAITAVTSVLCILWAEIQFAKKERKANAMRAIALKKLKTIVVTEGCDSGVILLSDDSPTHYDVELKGQVYDHEHFSPMGDALIELYEILAGAKA